MKDLIKEFRMDENGGATGWNLAWFAIVAAGAGLAVDISNARQAKEHLNAVAEAASHAGLIELLAGGSDADVRTVVLGNVNKNIPSASFGSVIADANRDIVIAKWDPETAAFTNDGNPNSVQVTVQRNESTTSALRTFLLNWVGFDQWDIRSAAATAFAQTQRCSNTEGIFAHGDIQLRSHNTFGEGICLHSKDKITMSNHNEFETGAFLSMPNLEDCAKCDDDSKNPGVVAAAHEANYQLTDVPAVIAQTYDSFLGGSDTGIKSDFFSGKSLDVDLSPLAAIGVETSELARGDVINLSGTQFATLPPSPRA